MTPGSHSRVGENANHGGIRTNRLQLLDLHTEFALDPRLASDCFQGDLDTTLTQLQDRLGECLCSARPTSSVTTAVLPLPSRFGKSAPSLVSWPHSAGIEHSHWRTMSRCTEYSNIIEPIGRCFARLKVRRRQVTVNPLSSPSHVDVVTASDR